MTVKKSGLGKGLTALLQNSSTDVSAKNPVPVNSVAEILISEIEANPFQPRQEFDEAALEELMDSIRLHGIIQPVTVRKVGYGKYELISGERRTRAARALGLKSIPAYVRLANDQSMLEMALIENIHRENLNPIEIAFSYKRLQDECSLKQEELAERVGKNRSTVTNYLRLLRLPEEIQIALRDHQITMGHARPLINIDNKELQLEVLDQIIDNELSVRSVEELIREKQKPEQLKGKKAPKQEVHSNIEEENLEVWQHKFSKLYEAHVKMKINKKGRGEIVIPFNSEADLKRLANLLENRK